MRLGGECSTPGGALIFEDDYNAVSNGIPAESHGFHWESFPEAPGFQPFPLEFLGKKWEFPWKWNPKWLRLQPNAFHTNSMEFHGIPTFHWESGGICRNSWRRVKTSTNWGMPTRTSTPAPQQTQATRTPTTHERPATTILSDNGRHQTMATHHQHQEWRPRPMCTWPRPMCMHQHQRQVAMSHQHYRQTPASTHQHHPPTSTSQSPTDSCRNPQDYTIISVILSWGENFCQVLRNPQDWDRVWQNFC